MASLNTKTYHCFALWALIDFYHPPPYSCVCWTVNCVIFGVILLWPGCYFKVILSGEIGCRLFSRLNFFICLHSAIVSLSFCVVLLAATVSVTLSPYSPIIACFPLAPSFRFKGHGEHFTPLHEVAQWCPGFICVFSRCHGAHWTAAVCGSPQIQMRANRRVFEPHTCRARK